MHHYPEDQSEENLKKICRNSVCAECGRQLAIYLDMETKRSYVACSGQVHEGITREYHPPVEDYITEARRDIKLTEEHGIHTSRALATIPKQGQLTQPQAMTVLKLVYPNAKEEEIVRTAIFCRDFGLHPLANEVYLIPFKGKNVMVVGIPASRKMAHALKGEFSFLDDTPRAASDIEVAKQFGKNSDEAKNNIISVTKLQGEGGNLAIGFGLYPKSEKPYGVDKGNTARNMANIRSERQAMDRLPGKPLPRFEVVDAAYADVPDVGRVDTGTGEVVEIESSENKVPPDAPESKSTAVEAGTGKEAPDQTDSEAEQGAVEPEVLSGIDPDWLKETLELIHWKEATAISWIKSQLTVEEDGSLVEILNTMNQEQLKLFVDHLSSMREVAGG